MFKKLIIDCEVRVVHEKARKPNFLSHSKEKIVQDIYKHPKINRAVKLWGVESIIKSMNKNKIKYALLSGLAWRNQKVLNDNNEYVVTEQGTHFINNICHSIFFCLLSSIRTDLFL